MIVGVGVHSKANIISLAFRDKSVIIQRRGWLSSIDAVERTRVIKVTFFNAY